MKRSGTVSNDLQLWRGASAIRRPVRCRRMFVNRPFRCHCRLITASDQASRDGCDVQNQGEVRGRVLLPLLIKAGEAS